MRDEKEERKKQARSNKQTRQSNTAHPRQSLFLENMYMYMWDTGSDKHALSQTSPYNIMVWVYLYRSAWPNNLELIGGNPTYYIRNLYLLPNKHCINFPWNAGNINESHITIVTCIYMCTLPPLHAVHLWHISTESSYMYMSHAPMPLQGSPLLIYTYALYVHVYTYA